MSSHPIDLVREAPPTPAENAARLIQNGYAPIPLPHGSKAPKIPGWQNRDFTAADFPGRANIGLRLGGESGLAFLDIDVTDAPAAKAIAAEWLARFASRGSVLRRTGAAPKTGLLIRTAPGTRKTYRDLGDLGRVEVLAEGQQVVAYGLHPDTGEPYHWHGLDPLDNFLGHVSMLPEVTPEEISDFLGWCAATYGPALKLSERAAQAAGFHIDTGTPRGSDSSFWRAVNDAALADLDAWVPALLPAAVKQATGAWRVSSAAFGRDFEEDLSIHPGGIQDFGPEVSLTAIDLVARETGNTTTEAAHWLCERLGTTPQALGWQEPQATATAQQEAPQPLVREIAPGADYPVAALGPLRAAVEAVQGMTQAPVAIPAQSALAVASLAVQGFANVETLGGPRPVSLYALTIAQSGERKSACDAPLMAALREHEREKAKGCGEDMTAWRNRHALWKGQHDRILAEAKRPQKPLSQSEAEAGLAALGAEPAAPPSADRTVSEPTFEGLTRLFAEGQPSLGLFSDEGGQFLGGHAMSSDNRQKTLAALNDLWQGNPIRRTRQGDGAYTLFGRRLAVHLMAQPGVARTFMADPLAMDTGFLPRFLICEPPSAIGTRMQAGTRINDTALVAFGGRLSEILEAEMPMDPDTRELTPRILPLSPEARTMLAGFADAIETAQAPGGNLAHITGTASKAAEQAARIAGVLTLWRDLSAPAVEAEGMADAITLAQYYLSEASRLASAANVSAEIDRAEALRKWLLESWPHAEVLKSDVVQRGPNPLRESPKAEAALLILEKHGWLVPLDPGTEVRGAARKQAWRIVKGAGHVV